MLIFVSTQSVEEKLVYLHIFLRRFKLTEKVSIPPSEGNTLTFRGNYYVCVILNFIEVSNVSLLLW